MGFLKGKKTYIVAAIAAIVIFLDLNGILDDATAQMILKFLGVSAVVTMRAGVTK